jgi:hypothetical protein
MRSALLPLALLALSLPLPALAYPNTYQRTTIETYGPAPGSNPLPVRSYRYGYNPGYPSGYGYNPGYSYNPGYGYGPGVGYGYPLAAAPPPPYTPSPASSCNLTTALVGAAVGGTLGAVLAPNGRDRRWSLPLGAAVGGIAGGAISGC